MKLIIKFNGTGNLTNYYGSEFYFTVVDDKGNNHEVSYALKNDIAYINVRGFSGCTLLWPDFDGLLEKIKSLFTNKDENNQLTIDQTRLDELRYHRPKHFPQLQALWTCGIINGSSLPRDDISFDEVICTGESRGGAAAMFIADHIKKTFPQVKVHLVAVLPTLGVSENSKLNHAIMDCKTPLDSVKVALIDETSEQMGPLLPYTRPVLPPSIGLTKNSSIVFSPGGHSHFDALMDPFFATYLKILFYRQLNKLDCIDPKSGEPSSERTQEEQKFIDQVLGEISKEAECRPLMDEKTEERYNASRDMQYSTNNEKNQSIIEEFIRNLITDKLILEKDEAFFTDLLNAFITYYDRKIPSPLLYGSLWDITWSSARYMKNIKPSNNHTGPSPIENNSIRARKDLEHQAIKIPPPPSFGWRCALFALNAVTILATGLIFAPLIAYAYAPRHITGWQRFIPFRHENTLAKKIALCCEKHVKDKAKDSSKTFDCHAIFNPPRRTRSPETYACYAGWAR